MPGKLELLLFFRIGVEFITKECNKGSGQIRRLPTCTNASQGKACGGAFEEDGLDGNTVCGRFKSSGYVGVPAIIPPHLVSQPRVLKSRKS